MHVEREHFFDPNFDCLGMQAVRNDELYSDFRYNAMYKYAAKYGGKPDGIFGYSPRYTEYKCGRDLLNGDFRIPHMNTGLESYHTWLLPNSRTIGMNACGKRITSTMPQRTKLPE